jgi:hypothetical protein
MDFFAAHPNHSPSQVNPQFAGLHNGLSLALAKFSGRVWWQDGQRKIEWYRERIGPNKSAAEQRLREVLTAWTEGRYIKKSPDGRTLFRTLAA